MKLKPWMIGGIIGLIVGLPPFYGLFLYVTNLRLARKLFDISIWPSTTLVSVLIIITIIESMLIGMLIGYLYQKKKLEFIGRLFKKLKLKPWMIGGIIAPIIGILTPLGMPHHLVNFILMGLVGRLVLNPVFGIIVMIMWIIVFILLGMFFGYLYQKKKSYFIWGIIIYIILTFASFYIVGLMWA